MASYCALLLIAAVALLFSPALSQSCKSQTFSQNNVTFPNCTDLPTLKASLHWHYDPASKPNPTLSVAFTAPPAQPDGWVAWGLNPNATGMNGTQAFVAFKEDNGSTVVKTYNISSYGPITESKLSYDVLSKSTETSTDTITIFATLLLPTASSELNQVWQVGSSVVNGVPVRHQFSPENLNSRTTLQLVTSAHNGPAPTPAPVGVASPTPGGRQNSAGASVWSSVLGVYAVCAVLAVSILGF